ncbi:MAG: bifunctional molybdenum cofactor biosynthesis protein MoaC/MoaB [Chitinophagaceae bacterium]|nr:bifunctional molybdenum cofactor biosynthesis protein MoaC/MoaB [Chitinophagaceae bacterium]
MRDITHKQITLRTAKAMGILFCSPSTIELIKNNQLPKGNLFDVARAAGFAGAKSTPQLLPHCHPVSIDGMDIQFDFLDNHKHTAHFDAAVLQRTGIVITGEAKSIGRTGIEMEMLTAVSVAALEIYDMLKPVDKLLEIGCIKLLEKKGGKSDRDRFITGNPSCAILVCSDSCVTGEREDKSGKQINAMLEQLRVTVKHYNIVDDNKESIQQQVMQWVNEDVQFIFITGGTGLGPRDVTTEAITAIIERKVPGIEEAIRSYGQMRTPLAMLSRSVAGTIGNSVVVALPGSTAGVRESLEAILPAVFHAANMIKGEGH